MRRLFLLIIIGMLVFGSTTFAGDKQSLSKRIINHPDVIKMEGFWFRIEIKENLSKTSFDWRFDVRRIELVRGSVYITHRMEQISVNAPTSSWVIINQFKIARDGTLDDFNQDRFISIKDQTSKENLWLIVIPMWPDKFEYPELKQSEILELYKKEMEYWESKL